MSAAGGGGLRLRLFLGLFGAASLALALLCVVLLLVVRDGIYARRMADAHAQLDGAESALVAGCPGAASPREAACVEQNAAVLARAGVQVLPRGACAELAGRTHERIALCVEQPEIGRALAVAVELAPVRDQLRALDAQMFAVLAAALLTLVLLSVWSLERGVVRRLSPIDLALDRLGLAQEAGEPELLSEGGDPLGRLSAAVNRLVERLRAERALTQQQIVTLQAANRLLAEEKRALREARQDLVRSERLASVGRLAAGVAHEVGNPLTAIIGYAALLQSRLPPNEAASDYAARIEREAARMDRILRDLLDLARPSAAAPEPIDLAAVIAQAQALVAPQPLWTGCALEVSLPGDLPRGLGIEHYAVQVLVNLFVNSARAKARRVLITGAAADGFVQLDLEDDGAGIPPENFPRLFEPFFSSAPPGEGTGLGLALCHASMERVGGSIAAVERPVGRGAHFVLRFRSAARART